jgi:hypothetical protein
MEVARMNPAESFSADYQEARQKFRTEADRVGGAIESVVHPQRGPDGRELATDIAWFGARDAESVLVLISGTHGVEGFCGSGAQIEWMRGGGVSRLPKSLGVLMIHAINPYGFAWLRRATHENVDLNRNWIDFSLPLPPNQAYETLSSVIIPREWTDESVKARKDAEARFAAEHGSTALGRAVSGGQYTHPTGIHYGGSAPSWSRRTQTAIFNSFLSRAAHIVILDIHSGLGQWGIGEQIVTQPVSSDGFRRARSWFGAAVTSIHDGSASSAAISGDGLSAAPALLAHAEVTTMALEFGTLSLECVHEAVCGGSWLQSHGDFESPLGRALGREIRAAFYGDTDDWKGMVVGQSLLACRQAVSGLSSSRKKHS